MTPAERFAKRDEFLTRLRQPAVLVMGIVNVTPDSFSDGGRYADIEQAVVHSARLVSEGADILDIGGESTRPGGEQVSLEEEWARVEGPLNALIRPDGPPVSIDTYKAEIARRAAEAGAVVINDVWGMTRDPDMAAAVAETGSVVVVTYNRGRADADIDVRADMLAFFERAFDKAEAAGIPKECIILDPGVGFAKTYKQNFAIIAHLEALQVFNCPILMGVSRKSFIGRLTGAPVDKRLMGTVVANLESVHRGASILRVHDVGAHREALDMYQAIGRAV